jgi:uncharacterized membrane protein
VVIAVIEIRAVDLAFTLAGLTPEWASVVLLASLLGSAVNIPVARLRSDIPEVQYAPVRYRGVIYVLPVGRPGKVTVAVNVGGAVVPILVSGYLLHRTGLWLPAAMAAGVVAVIVFATARPVENLGIVVPMFVPAFAAAAVALFIAEGHNVAIVAYVAGTMGTLIGGDLSNARAFRRLRARCLSIGGAGTFDGVFVAGVLAVILASIL